MRISVPSEVKNNEFRVALTPAGVHNLVQASHEVFVQSGAGAGSSMSDADYREAGATLLDDADEVWARERRTRWKPGTRSAPDAT